MDPSPVALVFPMDPRKRVASESGKQIERCVISTFQIAQRLQVRISPIGRPPADRRVITVWTPDPISSRGIEEAPPSAAPLAE
jgi:hypothetical protein